MLTNVPLFQYQSELYNAVDPTCILSLPSFITVLVVLFTPL